jgi:hypothetical protein
VIVHCEGRVDGGAKRNLLGGGGKRLGSGRDPERADVVAVAGADVEQLEEDGADKDLFGREAAAVRHDLLVGRRGEKVCFGKQLEHVASDKGSEN